MTHSVSVTMRLDVGAKGKLALVGAGGGLAGDETARLQKAADANVARLVEAARRYGFEISDVTVKVEQA